MFSGMHTHISDSGFMCEWRYREGETEVISDRPCCDRLLTVSSCPSTSVAVLMEVRGAARVKNQCEAIMISRTMNEEGIQNCSSQHSVCTHLSIAFVKGVVFITKISFTFSQPCNFPQVMSRHVCVGGEQSENDKEWR